MDSNNIQLNDSESEEVNNAYIQDYYNLSNTSVNELLIKYQNHPELLNHILIAKAEEDKKLSIEEWKRAENARLQSNYIEYELNQLRESNNNAEQQLLDSLNDEYLNSQSFFAEPMMIFNEHQQDVNQNIAFVPDESSSQITSSSDFYFMPQHQNTTTSVTSNSSSVFNAYGQQETLNLSESPSNASLSPMASYVYQSTSLASINSNTQCSHSNTIESIPSTSPSVKSKSITKSASNQTANTSSKGSTAIIKSRSGRSIVHRTLSYESVMNLEEYNLKIINQINIKKNKKEESIRRRSLSPPSPPLEHRKVMEALRAKLKRLSTPCHSKSTPSKSISTTTSIPLPGSSSPPPPLPPQSPPNTHPTTGVLLLDLNNRKRKTSTRKRASSDNWNFNDTIP